MRRLEFYDLLTRKVSPLPLYRNRRNLPCRSLLTRQTADGVPQLLIGTRGQIEVWHLEANTQIARITTRHKADITALHAIPWAGGELLAAPTPDGVQLWDCETWEPHLLLDALEVKAMASVPTADGTPLLACGDGHSITLWEPGTGALRSTVITAALVEQLATVLDAQEPATYLAASGPRGLAMLQLWPTQDTLATAPDRPMP
jgi:hypothetical protein